MHQVTSETLVPTYPTTRRHFLERNNLRSDQRETSRYYATRGSGR